MLKCVWVLNMQMNFYLCQWTNIIHNSSTLTFDEVLGKLSKRGFTSESWTWKYEELKYMLLSWKLNIYKALREGAPDFKKFISISGIFQPTNFYTVSKVAIKSMIWNGNLIKLSNAFGCTESFRVAGHSSWWRYLESYYSRIIRNCFHIEMPTVALQIARILCLVVTASAPVSE